MKILCRTCRSELRDNDNVVMDWINTLYHLKCCDLEQTLIKNIDTYRNIKENYWFFAEKPINKLLS